MTSIVDVERAQLLTTVKDVICEIWNLSPREQELTPTQLPDDCLLFDVDRDGRVNLQLDSLDALEISLRLEEVFRVVIPETFDPHEISTPNRMVAWISTLKRGGE